eukprot:m.864539 g.864539  ORF g.864539 m.864539 type:complete len:261 (+) comp23547_c0_seq16:2075-2857(+)
MSSPLDVKDTAKTLLDVNERIVDGIRSYATADRGRWCLSTQDTVQCGVCLFSGVEQDYLEVPSMAFEQMVYREDVLQRLSSHFETQKPLDAATIARVARAKGHLSALRYRRFLAQAMFDMFIHGGNAPYTFRGQTGLDMQSLWTTLHADVAGYSPQPGTFFPSGWYHMVIGYDAGYWGYLWSEVWAYDALQKFDGLTLRSTDTAATSDGASTLQAVGVQYRKCLLEPGASVSATDMLVNFLGRPPSMDAFFREVMPPESK